MKAAFDCRGVLFIGLHQSSISASMAMKASSAVTLRSRMTVKLRDMLEAIKFVNEGFVVLD
jgi:hypothetical protein